MFRRTKICTAAVLALGGGALLGGASAFAQEVQRVEITGSSIKRIDAEQSLPVQVINRADIARTGATSVAELIQNLPAVQGFTQSSQAVGGGGAGFSGASIHSVGETRTLILLNGRRVASWAGQTLTGYGAGIDLNSIPLAAIERVELLSDGASALYGTDAIAGVINFILRKDLTTGEATLDHSVPKGSVGKNTKLTLSKGWGTLAENGFNAMITVSADKQEQMKSTDRDFAKTGVIPFTHNGQNLVFFNGSIRGVPANYEIVSQAVDANGDPVRDLLGNPYFNANGTCPPQHVFRGGACRFDYTSTIEILPEAERQSLFGTFSKSLGTDHTLSFDLAFNRFKLISRIAPPPVDMLIPTGSALYDRYMPGGAAVLDPTSQYGDDLFAYWRGMDVGPRTTEDKTTAAHFATALQGTFGKWDYSTALTYSTNKWVESHLSGWLKQNEQDAAIASGAFDPFLGPGQQSAAGVAALAGMQNRGVFKTERSTLTAFELRGSTELFKLNNRGVQLGLGADVRRENVKYDPSAIARGAGNTIAGDSSQEAPFDVNRDVWGAYSELLVPVAKGLELNGAIRYDHYNDFGNTTNGKVSARYQPTKEVLLRASAGTGYRAPSVPQIAAGRQLYGVTGNTYDCPTAARDALRAVDPTAECRTAGSQYEQFVAGNKDLKPEKSRQWTLGLVIEPTNNISVGADLWAVHIKDRISQLTEETVMADPVTYLKNFTIFNDPGTGRHFVALYLPNENLGEERYRGVDVLGKLVVDTGIGKLTTNLNWTYIDKYEYQRIKNGPWYTNVSMYNDSAVTFRNIAKLQAVLRTGAIENALTISYKSAYKDQPCDDVNCRLVRRVNPDGSIGGVVGVTDREVGSYSTWDWQGKYDFSKSLTFTLGILNLFDQDPPLTLKQSGGHQLGYDNRYTDPRGRTIYGSVAFRF